MKRPHAKLCSGLLLLLFPLASIYSPHTRIQAKEEKIAEFEGKSTSPTHAHAPMISREGKRNFFTAKPRLRDA